MRTVLLVLAALTTVSAQSSSLAPRAYFTEPAISPDRSEIAFVSGGDIWAVSASGGEARLLLSHPANESRPLYAPDGRRLAFVSNRTGGGDIYLLTLATGAVARLTYDDGNEQLDGWSRDGAWIYFSSTSHDIAGMNDVFRVSAEGGTPMEVAADRYTNEYFSSASPDGRTLAITARANASGQWWRNGRSHLDEAEIWLAREGETPGYEPVTSGGAKEMWPLWATDGQSVFFVSDRNGTQNLWRQAVGAPGTAARPLTAFKTGRVLWPSISHDGRLIVFEHDFEIWTLDTTTERASRLEVSRRGAPAITGVEHLTLTEGFTELDLSPDGKKVAFVARGEVFAASAKDGGDAARISRTPESEASVTWSPDSRTLVYTSDRDGTGHLYLYDFGANTETRLTSGTDSDHSAAFSPDGKVIAFVRGDNELRVLDVATRQDRSIARGVFDRPPFAGEPPFAWSPDNRWLAYLSAGAKMFTNVHLVGLDGAAPRAASFLANSFANTISWSADGKAVYFDTGQRTELRQIARIDLTPRTPQFREDQFRDLFREEPVRPPRPADPPKETAPPENAAGDTRDSAKAPVQVVFDDIRQRLSLLPTGLDAGSQRVSPDGKSLLIIGRAAGQQNLYTFSIDELSHEPAVARQLTSTAGAKSDAEFTPDGKEVFLLEQGRITVITVENRTSRRLSVSAEMDVDFAVEKMQVFQQAWSYLRDSFFDPRFNGVDWPAVRARYAPLVAGAATRDEMRRLLSLMVGELNASHLGVNAPAGGGPVVGKLGLRFDRREYEQNGRFKVTEVIPLTPAAIAGVRAEEYLLAVNGTTLGARVNLEQVLSHTINRRVDLVVAADAAGGNRRTVPVQPTNQATEKNLAYRQWVEKNRAYVTRESNGRLGYVHMFDMSDAALNQLNVDLDAENHGRDGVVVDVRNNNGGFVNMYALDVFTRKNYLTMTPRGGVSAPGRTVLGQRALGAPTILVTNQHSLSDAEDFTEGYRALKLGKVVGEPTSGWIVYTSNMPLIDGTVIRLPGMRVDDSSGKMMEQAPRQVDVPVKRRVGESYTGRDAQLDMAVGELMKQLGPRAATQ
ncbi:MAG TPA: LpqB family beta-propeller domain-containing protein [Vicinamibacterales bacterium]|nr:LpqB family beta-propeller domain-containing protein [Vicinamibacterales bacterium]